MRQLKNRAWWTTIDDFDGGWCPCTGAVRKLPNVILNIWYRQSGKSVNLTRLAIDYKVKYPSSKVCIITATNTRYIHEKLESIAENEGLEDVAMGIHLANCQNTEHVFTTRDFDLVLLDEFLHYEEKHLSKIVEGWNSGNKTGTIIGWSTPSRATSYDKVLRTVEMKGGTRTMINKFRASDNEEKVNIPHYMRKGDIDLEYNLNYE